MKLWRKEYPRANEDGSTVDVDEQTPIVLLHGLLGSSENWHTVASALSAWWRVVAVDLRNHGRSPHSQRHDYDAMAGDLDEFLDEMAIERCLLVGHSMGGKVAMRFALDRPARVRALVVEDMVPSETEPRYSHYLEALRSLDLSSTASRVEAERRLSSAVPDEGIRLFLLKNLERGDTGYRWRPNLETLAREERSLAGALEARGRYDGPALFIIGGRSEIVTRDNSMTISDYFPQAEIQAIPGAGHWVHAWFQDEFTAQLRAFFSGLAT